MIGHGVTLTGSEAGAIGKLTNVNWGGLVYDDVETTDFNSPRRRRQYEAGLGEPGEITADLIFDATLKATVVANLRVAQTWTIAKSGTTLLIDYGYIKSYGLTIPIGDEVMMPIGIKLSTSSSSSSLSSSSSSSGA